MSKPISLFSGYTQRENRTTNYCLLALKLLYEENPKFLGEVLGNLVDERLADLVGVKFRQQQRRKESVPDGLILQDAFSLYIETKNFDWFYDSQLEKHLSALDQEFPGFKVLIALSNFDESASGRFDRIRELCATLYQNSIIFADVSFEDFVAAMELELLPKNLADAVADLRNYLDEQNLLSTWESWLDVVNCARIPKDILDAGAYMCPATGGAYRHSRCKYFGMYRGKRVQHVALIEAVVDLDGAEEATLLWMNASGKKTQFIRRAREALADRRPGQYPTRVFLLGPLHATAFRKDTSGGMMGSKQYFDIGGLEVDGPSALAAALDGRTWSDLRQGAVS